MVLVITVPATSASYLVDVGFGGVGPMAPLCVDTGDAHAQVDGAYRIVSVDDREPLLNGHYNNYRALQWQLKGEWLDMYWFRDEEASASDLELSNFFSYAHPKARWVSCVFAARVIGDARHHLLDGEYSIRQPDGSVERTRVNGSDALLQLLASVFGLEFAAGTQFIIQ